MVGGYTYGSMEATKIGLNFGNLLQRLRRRRVLEEENRIAQDDGWLDSLRCSSHYGHHTSIHRLHTRPIGAV